MAADAAPRRGIGTATAVVEGAADGLADGIDREHLNESVPGLVRDAATPIAQRGVRSERLRARLEEADEKVSQVIDATRDKARAVAESARRARKAPAQAWADAKDGAKAYANGLVASIVSYTIAGLVGAIALILLTVGAVQGLNDAWGAPRGTFAVAGLFVVLALVFAAMAKGKAQAGRRTAKLRMAQARLELQRVAEPLREAFRGEPRPTTIPIQHSTPGDVQRPASDVSPSDETFPRT